MAKAAKPKEWAGSITAFGNALEQIRRNPNPVLLYVGVYTAASIISLVIQGKSTYNEKGYVPYADMLLLLFILPITMYSLAVADKKMLTISEFMQINFKKLVMMIATSILATLAIAVSIVAFIFPVVWVAAWFAFGIFLVAEKDLSPVQALKESKRLASEHKAKIWRLIGITLLVSIAMTVLSVVPYVGVAAIAFSSIWNTAASAHLYRWLQKQ
jgi:hypothetical protein